MSMGDFSSIPVDQLSRIYPCKFGMKLNECLEMRIGAGKYNVLSGMKKMKTKVILIAVIVMMMTGSALADWLQYLGPNRNATSPEKGLLRSWPQAGPKLLWTVPLGPGYGGAAVSDGKVYVLDRIRSKQDVLRCLDLATGEEQWTYVYDAQGRASHPG